MQTIPATNTHTLMICKLCYMRLIKRMLGQQNLEIIVQIYMFLLLLMLLLFFFIMAP